ncbi:hypothetical protein [Stenotrophomonas nematodicola]|uniref:YbbD head domain-containing protein n=1 Tax=Stenotrophomonas nematodicola TaxID=2656746 RepID=A0ABW7CU74_9GAMM
MRTLPLSCAAVLGTALCAGCTGDVMHAAYPDRAAAIRDDAVGRGWVPAWVPASATDLREVHDLDNNQSALSFATGSERWLPPGDCRSVAADLVIPSALQLHPWPSLEVVLAHYDVRRCDEPESATESFLAIPRDRGRALFWRVHRR